MVVGMFQWGKKKGIGRKNRDFHFYESFIYYNVEYFLFDYVYVYNTTDVDAYIGKIVRIFETPDHERKIKLVWLFRPAEIRNFLRGYEPKWNELFLACGDGKGLSNINPVESIIRKCNVVCASHDIRNPQAAEEQLRMADFIFSHCFDVGERRIIEKLADHISGIEVEYFFNKWKDQKDNTAEVNGRTETKKINSSNQFVQGAESKKRVASVGVQKHFSDECATSRPKNPIDTNDGFDALPVKRRKLFPEATLVSENVGTHVVDVVNNIGKIVTKNDVKKRRWFKKMPYPWLERLKRAEEAGALVLLENLDPSFTSSEVEDLVQLAFNQTAEAKMIQRSTFSSPYYGKALVLFESKVGAVSAIKELQGRCLIMEDGRPIIGRKCSLNSGEIASFRGHLSIHQFRHKQSEEMRKAVSTSHCSQPNTLEYDMAVEWGVLQEQSDIWWKNLFMKQAKTIENVKKQQKTS